MKILHTAATNHHKLKVTQEGTTRKLISGAGFCEEQSAINVDDLQDHIYDYSLLALHSLRFIESPSRILVIGLGGGIVPREMSRYLPNAEIDVIEIDPEIIKLAKEFFFFEETDKIKVHCGDAFIVTQEMEKTYDIIVADAFLSHYIPFPLMSIEFIKVMHSLLSSQGVVAANSSNFHPSFNNQINTYRAVFGDDIYRLDGLRNDASTTLYVVKGGMEPEYELEDLYLLTPKKIDMTETIKDAKIFTLTNP